VDGGEFAYIDWLREKLRADGAGGTGPSADGLLIGPGDDCAVIAASGSPGGLRGKVLLKVDSVAEGRHFRLDDPGAAGFATPEQVGFKAVARTVSDIAAMGGVPRFALAAATLRRGAGPALREGLLIGMQRACKQFQLTLAGGDTGAWDSPTVLSVSVIGEMQRLDPVPRSGARPGDILCATGSFGGSLLARHAAPTPRLAEGQALAQARASAMIDVSDGLAQDGWQLLRESSRAAAAPLGFILESARIPLSPDATRAAILDGRTPLEHALHDGEDYELLTAVPAQTYALLEQHWRGPAPLTRIGTVTSTPGLWLQAPDGTTTPLAPRGYEHGL
jgi:thiamine-monophosphate kinase